MHRSPSAEKSEAKGRLLLSSGFTGRSRRSPLLCLAVSRYSQLQVRPAHAASFQSTEPSLSFANLSLHTRFSCVKTLDISRLSAAPWIGPDPFEGSAAGPVSGDVRRASVPDPLLPSPRRDDTCNAAIGHATQCNQPPHLCRESWASPDLFGPPSVDVKAYGMLGNDTPNPSSWLQELFVLVSKPSSHRARSKQLTPLGVW